MTRFLSFSARNFAIGYVALGIAVLALFAAPVGIEWNRRVDRARTEFLREDVSRLSEIFQRKGAEGLAAAIDAQVGRRMHGEKLLLLADPSLSRLAGNLPGWPREVPPTPGGHALLIMINHGISTGALFFLVGMIYERRHSRLIESYGGIARVVPLFAAILTLVSLSSIALPGTNGFVGEFLVLIGSFSFSFSGCASGL